MLGYLQEVWRCAHLKTKSERLLREQMVELLEQNQRQPVSEEGDDWVPLGRTGTEHLPEQRELRQLARDLAERNPHAKNYLRLLEIYVTGAGLHLTHVACFDHDCSELQMMMDRLWSEFLLTNRNHYSFREHARRTWRDGECFIRKFATGVWPPAVRFVDPELIDETPEHAGSQGILTHDRDVETPEYYVLIHRQRGEIDQLIPADEMLHTRYGVDSNQKRGRTVLVPLMDILTRFEKWIETELLARKLQSSIVLWRKVQGSAAQLQGMIDGSSGISDTSRGGGSRKERIKPGTILTTSPGTEMKFLQPDTNFADAVPLGRMMLLSLSAGAGLLEFMLTADASNSNLASTLIAEGPAVKFFEAEQHYFVQEFNRLWRWVMSEAMDAGLLPDDALEHVQPKWSLPKLAVHNRADERMADTKLVELGILSRAEVARRDGVEPARMLREIDAERELQPQSDLGH
jgi:capsid protein